MANHGLRRRPEEHPVDRIPAVDAEHDQIACLFAGDAEKLVMRFPRRHDLFDGTFFWFAFATASCNRSRAAASAVIR